MRLGGWGAVRPCSSVLCLCQFLWSLSLPDMPVRTCGWKEMKCERKGTTNPWEIKTFDIGASVMSDLARLRRPAGRNRNAARRLKKSLTGQGTPGGYKTWFAWTTSPECLHSPCFKLGRASAGGTASWGEQEGAKARKWWHTGASHTAYNCHKCKGRLGTQQSCGFRHCPLEN